jgi:hypothetical protein
LLLAFLLTLLSGGAAAQTTGENEPDPFAALTAANNKPAVVYVSPDTAVTVIDATRLRLSAADLTVTATKLAMTVSINRMHEQEKDLPLCSRMIGLALQMDPGNAAAAALDKQLKAGLEPLSTAGGLTREKLASHLCLMARQCRETGSVGDRKLAVYLVSLAVDLDPTNKDAATVYAAYTSSGIAADWRFALGASAATAPTDVPLPLGSNPAPSARAMLQPVQNPEFGKRDKNFARRQSSIKSLMIMTDEQGLMLGEVVDVIATVSPLPGGFAHKANLSFARPIGRQMNIACEEAIRAIQIRYPFWESAQLSVSFGDKYTPKDGGSSGGAFALLLLSLLDGLSYDDGFAMTGDVTVDWKIRKVGAVAEKIRGAVRARCPVVVVPMSNERAVADVMLLYPMDVLLQVQVFGVNEIGEAVEVARTDRSPNLVQAMTLYRNVQQMVQQTSIMALNNARAQSALDEILKLAPNHLSAKYLLLYARNQSPPRLSLSTSMQETMAAAGPLLIFLAPVAPAEIGLSDAVFTKAKQNILDLRGKIDPEAEPLHTALCAFVGTVEKMHLIEVGPGPASRKKALQKNMEPRLKADRDKVIAVIEGIHENKEFLDRIMNQ